MEYNSSWNVRLSVRLSAHAEVSRRSQRTAEYSGGLSLPRPKGRGISPVPVFGDIFLAFATGNHIPLSAQAPLAVQALPNSQMDPLFDATAEAVEEAILNALCAAETMTGFQGRTVHALPLDKLQQIMAVYR